jgi:hypothetical protein
VGKCAVFSVASSEFFNFLVEVKEIRYTGNIIKINIKNSI